VRGKIKSNAQALLPSRNGALRIADVGKNENEALSNGARTL
jgi:hypothetical protein